MWVSFNELNTLHIGLLMPCLFSHWRGVKTISCNKARVTTSCSFGGWKDLAIFCINMGNLTIVGGRVRVIFCGKVDSLAIVGKTRQWTRINKLSVISCRYLWII